MTKGEKPKHFPAVVTFADECSLHGSEQEIKEEQTRLLQGVLLRKLATPIGRAMLTLASRPFKVTEKWQMPPVNLGVRTVPHGSVIAEPPAHMMGELDWPEFHNGVASALQIASGPHHIDSNWVFSHYQPEEPSARHAGFLFGIGLMGHLTSLGRVHAFKYLYPRHGLTTIGTILGLAASFVGTGDPTARQLMAIQVSAFLPEGSAPLNLSTLTQTAGLLGMGMVFMGSYHRWTAERMLQQIGAKELQTSNDQLYMRENYSLSAGMALGMIMLGKGRRDPMTSTQDKLMIAQLQGLMVGKAESFSEDDIPTGTPMLDVSTTSISATIALGLIFLGSNRLDIAEMVEIPETIRGLDFVRPDVLLVRILARHLILWDRIQPSDEWLEVSLPNVIRRVRASGRAMGEAAQLAYYNMRAGACFALALKYAGSGNLEAKKCLMRQLKSFSREAGVRGMYLLSFGRSMNAVLTRPTASFLQRLTILPRSDSRLCALVPICLPCPSLW